MELKPVLISKDTGYAATDNTPDKVWSWISKRAKPLRKSPYEKIIYTNKAGTEEVCSLCWNENDIVKTVKTVYPPDVTSFLSSQGNENYKYIPHKSDCQAYGNNKSIEFIYPKNDSLILVPRNFDNKYEKVKVKSSSATATALYWYLDSKFFGNDN